MTPDPERCPSCDTSIPGPSHPYERCQDAWHAPAPDPVERPPVTEAVSIAQGLLQWSNVKDWMLSANGHGLGYDSQTITRSSAFVRCPFCDYILPPGSVLGGAS